MFKPLFLWIFCPLQRDLISTFASNLLFYSLHPDLQNSLLTDDKIPSLIQLTFTLWDLSWSLPLCGNSCFTRTLAFVPSLYHIQAFYFPFWAEAWRQEGLFSDYIIIIFPWLIDWRFDWTLYLSFISIPSGQFSWFPFLQLTNRYLFNQNKDL